MVEDNLGMEKIMCKGPAARMNFVCMDNLKQKEGQRMGPWWARAAQGQRVAGTC